MTQTSLSAASAYLASPDLEDELRQELEPIVRAAEGGDAAALAEAPDLARTIRRISLVHGGNDSAFLISSSPE